MEKAFPTLVMEKLLKKSGVIRVSESAKVELCNILSEKAQEISKQANEFCLHAGRKTVRKEDILLALK